LVKKTSDDKHNVLLEVYPTGLVNSLSIFIQIDDSF